MVDRELRGHPYKAEETGGGCHPGRGALPSADLGSVCGTLQAPGPARPTCLLCSPEAEEEWRVVSRILDGDSLCKPRCVA